MDRKWGKGLKMLRWNPHRDYPQIDESAYIDSTAVIAGKVSIGKNVFVGPTAVIRADEPGSSITINANSNVQDRVIIHALKNSSVLIEENTSLAHGCIIHGPCKIAKNCFVGFGSVVFDAEIEEGVIIKHLAVVEKANISTGRVVESSQLVNRKDKAEELKLTDKNLRDFAQNVVEMNLDLLKSYKKRQ